MKLRKNIMALTIALIVGFLAIVNTASAEDSYQCTLTGYTYMGGTGFNNTNTSYFIAGPMEYWFSGSDMYGFAWIKFDNIGTEEVDAAYLNLDLLKVGSMNLEDASEAFPGIVDVYSPGDTNVAGFTGVADTNALHAILKADPSTYLLAEDVTMTSNGVRAIDITDIYNAWVAGMQANNGLILYSDSPNANAAGGTIGAVGTKYAGLDGIEGTVPYINTVILPMVSMTGPENNATDVALDAVIKITFSEKMNTITVEGAFVINPSVSGSFSWSEQDSVCTFTPDSDLSPSTGYQVTIGTAAADLAGNLLAEEYVFGFNTLNRPPVLDSIDNKTVDEGVNLDFTVTATDPDGDTVTFSFTSNPEMSGATLDENTGAFSWTPAAGSTGTYEVTVTATDNGTPVESDQEIFTITVGNVNRPPELAAISDKNVNEGVNLNFIVSAVDPDNDTVTYGFTSDPGMPGATLNENTGAFSWTPGYDSAGTYEVTVTATDNGTPAESDQETFIITVGNVNRPPELETISDRNVNEGVILSFTVIATDPDNDTVTYGFTSDPGMSGAVLNESTGAFSWTPGYDSAGTYEVTVTATDNGTPAESDQETFTITVGNVNRAPELETISNKNITEGINLSFNVSATDPDNDTVTYCFTSDPGMSGATLKENTGAFSWTPPADSAGTYEVTVTATDNGSPVKTDNETFTVTVSSGSTAGAVYECTLTGYTFMGGGSAKTSNSSSNKNDDYFLAQPLHYMYGSQDMWGYAWIKFNTIGTEVVEEVKLTLDLMGVGGMNIVDATEAYPGIVDIYSPGATDVEDLGADGETAATLREALKDELLSATPLVDDFTMTGNGIYTIDITDIYNDWVTGAVDNNGLVLVSYSENENSTDVEGAVGTQYASISGDMGTAPYITIVVNTPPAVKTTSPENNARDIGVDTSITITFDKSMDAESTEGAFSLSPEGDSSSTITGTLSWSVHNTVLTFIPAGFLAHETTYSVTIGTDAGDSTGQNIAGVYIVSFTTGAYVTPSPQVTGSPEGTVAVDTVELTISGDGVFAYRYALDDDAWSDSRDPSEKLKLTGISDGEHTLNIQVMDSLDNWTDLDNITWTVMAPPKVVSVSPEPDGTASVTDQIKVTFSEAMDPDSVENAFGISPGVEGALSWEGETILVFTPATVLESETGYTVTIAATAADPAGNTLAGEYTWKFTTLVANTLRCSLSEDTYVLFGGMGSGVGYPQGTSMGEYKLKAGAVSIVDARILMRFDLSSITEKGLSAEDIESAYLVYTMQTNTDNMDVGPPAPEGTAMYGFIHVLNTTTREKTGETVEPFFWNEDVQGEAGYVDMNNKPWYVTEAPYVLVTHTTGPDSIGKVDIAPVVKGWLDGSWENNGLEIRDQDDQSWVGNPDVFGAEYGDGFSWHLASREDTEDGPYLLVTYDTDKLRIDNRTVSSEVMANGATRVLTASGGSGSYQWMVNGPDGSDVTASVLSASTGSQVTFTAPDVSGLATVTLSSGDETDRIFIGIGSAVAGSSEQAPLYLDPGTTEEKQDLLTGICSDALEQIGEFGNLSRIDLAENNAQTCIGGTARDDGAKMLITAINSPADLTEPVEIFFDTITGLPVTIEISADSVISNVQQLYVVAVDTGSSSPGDASGLFMFELYDENGDPLADEAIAQVQITIPFDSGVTGSDPFSQGVWKIVHAPDLDTFFSGDEDAEIETVSTDDIADVDETNMTVTFDTDHCSVYGVISGIETELNNTTSGATSLGGGCFISTLF
jgi:hypothetical protein